MCGINGIFFYEKNAKITTDTVSKMNDRLAHRGPNNGNVYEGNHVVLGHRRLSIIDLSEAGNQPMTTPDGRYTMVYNGELYNYREVRDQLVGVQFATNSDTEVVLAAYVKWGPACLRAFNGMFAFAIWDNLENKLFLARDRMGIKPLYFYKSDNFLVFSSEMRALLESDLVPRKLDHNSLADYLRFQTVHAPQTIIDDVYMLLPGHTITIAEDHFQIDKYWSVNGQFDAHVARESYNKTKENVKEHLFKAVERRLVADVPFGAFLSGGIDSSAIVGIMSEVGERKVQTFSVVFEEEEFSEAKYARMIAEKFKTEHHEIKLSPEHFLETIPEALKAMDHPSGDGPNTYMVSKATKDAGITMALSGLGGDELFAGYDIFKRAIELTNKKWLLSFPPFARKFGGAMLKKMRPGPGSDKIAETLKLGRFDVCETYPISRQVMMDPVVSKLLKGKLLPPNKVGEIAVDLTGYESDGFRFPSLSHVSFNEINTYMQNVLLRDTDQMSMANALEVRVPFLDHELAEYVFNIPNKYKYPHSPKKLLVDSLGSLLPREIVDRPKMGFVLPWDNWLKGEMRSFTEGKLKALAQRGVLDGQELDKIWKSFLAGDPRYGWARIWPLVVLENWMEEHNVEV
jgi:asparagine synthase (glutamine-hydrolysing)